MSDSLPIDQPELVALFGPRLPMEAVQLVFGPGHETKTLTEVRAELTAMAPRYTSDALAKVFAATIPRDLRWYRLHKDEDDTQFVWQMPTGMASVAVERGSRAITYAYLVGATALPGVDINATVDAFPPDLARALRSDSFQHEARVASERGTYA